MNDKKMKKTVELNEEDIITMIANYLEEDKKDVHIEIYKDSVEHIDKVRVIVERDIY